MAITADLPEFDKPPVDEVILGTQFERLSGLQAPHLGLVWGRFREMFPRVAQKEPISRATEQFGPPVNGQITVELSQDYATPRCWFIAADDSQLIQVQQDRFLHNWRKREDDYPRYSHLRERFMEELGQLSDFVREEGIGPLHHDQCEVTYSNVIVLEEGDGFAGVAKVSPLLSGAPSEGFLPVQETIRHKVTYPITVEGDPTPLGRLHVDFIPGHRKADLRPIVALRLTARGAPIGDEIEGVMEFLDLGHEWIVRGFTSVTSEAMHTLWGRTR